MAYQSECDKCKEYWSTYELVFIELTSQIMCPYCINELINELASDVTQ